MKLLSVHTAAVLINAALATREQLLERVEFWKARPHHPKSAELQKADDDRLREIDAALKELAEGLAPWLKHDPKLKHLFNQEASTTQPPETA